MNHLYYAKLQLLKLLLEPLQLTFLLPFFPSFLVISKPVILRSGHQLSHSNFSQIFSCVLQSASGLVYNATFGAERINDK